MTASVSFAPLAGFIPPGQSRGDNLPPTHSVTAGSNSHLTGFLQGAPGQSRGGVANSWHWSGTVAGLYQAGAQ